MAQRSTHLKWCIAKLLSYWAEHLFCVTGVGLLCQQTGSGSVCRCYLRFQVGIFFSLSLSLEVLMVVLLQTCVKCLHIFHGHSFQFQVYPSLKCIQCHIMSNSFIWLSWALKLFSLFQETQVAGNVFSCFASLVSQILWINAQTSLFCRHSNVVQW